MQHNNITTSPADSDQTTDRVGVGRSDLLGLSLTEAAEATEIFKRFHELIYSKMGSRLVAGMQKRQSEPMEDSEMAKAYERGYSAGREAGLQTWPADISEFSVVEVVQALRGPNS